MLIVVIPPTQPCRDRQLAVRETRSQVQHTQLTEETDLAPDSSQQVDIAVSLNTILKHDDAAKAVPDQHQRIGCSGTRNRLFYAFKNGVTVSEPRHYIANE